MSKNHGIKKLIFAIIFICSCNNALVEIPNVTTNKKVSYSIISVIHADANYLFHKNGVAKNANKVALAKSKRIAENAKNGEVFIFHQKPERKAWLFFPKKDREWFHYKNGELVNKGKYSPVDWGFTQESKIYNTQSAVNEISRKPMLMYFGHEIPTFTRMYHQSQKPALFNVPIFADGVSAFHENFSLIGISTCNNGNPLVMNALKDKAEYVVASPQNLHLSYLDMDAFMELEKNQDITNNELAISLAESSFDRLSSELETTVTVGVYSLNEINDGISDFADAYSKYINRNKANSYFSDNIDCKNVEALKDFIPKNGVQLYYEASMFGSKVINQNHSGWGCKNLPIKN